MDQQSPTLQKIHQIAKRHFLEQGFQRASLRKIVSDAGFTLGAFYGYYSSKEELFCALTDETARGVLSALAEMAGKLGEIPPDRKLAQMSEIFLDGLPALVDFLLARPDETRLLLRCAEGTQYQDFLSGMMEQNLTFMRQAAGAELPLHPLAQKLLVKSYFSMLGEAVLEGAPREDILAAMRDVQRVFGGGMIGLLESGEHGKTERTAVNSAYQAKNRNREVRR